MEKIILNKNETYLVKFNLSNTITQLTVMMITATAYQFKYVNGNTIWLDKSEVESEIKVIENITNFVVTNWTKVTICPICYGIGTIPDYNSITLSKICPLCNGNKII